MSRDKRRQKQFGIVQWFDPKTQTWSQSEVHEVGQINERVVQMLGGVWTRSEGRLGRDGATAFWNSRNGRRVFVMTMPPGLPQAAAERVARAT